MWIPEACDFRIATRKLRLLVVMVTVPRFVEAVPLSKAMPHCHIYLITYILMNRLLKNQTHVYTMYPLKEYE